MLSRGMLEAKGMTTLRRRDGEMLGQRVGHAERFCISPIALSLTLAWCRVIHFFLAQNTSLFRRPISNSLTDHEMEKHLN